MSTRRLFDAIVFSTLLACTFSYAQEPEGRSQIPLAGDWLHRFAAKGKTVAPPASWSRDAKTFPGTVKIKEGIEGLWIKRDIEIPATWKGFKSILVLEHPLFAAAVYVNGKSAGTVMSYGGELDLSAHAKPGTNSSLELFFPRSGGTLISDDPWISKVVAKKPVWANKVGVLGMPGTFRIERRTPTIEVSGVWYKTFTRGGVRIEPQLELKAAKALKGVKAEVCVYDAAGTDGIPVLSSIFKLGNLPAGDSLRRLKMPAANLKLWGLREPNLYYGQVRLLDASGKELDRSNPELFGVREFWISGRDYYLNGVKTHLTLDHTANKFKSTEDALKAGVTLSYTKHAKNAAHLVHDNAAEAFKHDRLGMGYISYSVDIDRDSPNLADKAVRAAYRRFLDSRMKRMRNHPSILFWVFSINIVGSTHDPVKIGRSSRKNRNLNGNISLAEQKRADDTRPAFHHMGVGVGDIDSGNFYFNHLPVQSVEDWLSAWRKDGDKPFMFIEYMGGPMKRDFRGYTTEYLARLYGDRAYQEESQALRDYTSLIRPRLHKWHVNPWAYSPLALEYSLDFIPKTSFNARYNGVPFDLWVFPPKKQLLKAGGPELEAIRKRNEVAKGVLSPDSFQLGGPADDWTSKTHAFRAGERIVKSVLCVHDRNTTVEIEVNWEARVEGEAKSLASGVLKSTLGPWSRNALEFEFKAPANDSTKPLKMELSARVSGPDGISAKLGPFACEVWPDAKPVAAPAYFTVIDPEEKSSAWLEKAGAKLKPFDAAGTKPEILVIGRGAMRQLDKLPFTAEDVRNGLRVLFCEQYGGDLERLGFRVDDHCPRVAFPGKAATVILDGLDARALHDWNGDATLLPWGPERDPTFTPPSRRAPHWSNKGSVISVMIETPQHGPFKSLIDCEFDLAYSGLLSWRHGAGEILFLQADVSGRTASDPAVELLGRNIVRHFNKPLKGRQAKTVLCASPASLETAAALGFKTALLSEAGELKPEDATILFGKKDAELWPRFKEKALSFAKAGGSVLFLSAGEKLFSDDVFSGLRLKPFRASKAADRIDASPLLDGVGLQNVRWRGEIDLLAIAAEPGVPFQGLLNGLAGIMPLGRGQLTFLQIERDAFEDYTAMRERDANLRKPDEKPLTDAWFSKNRNRSRWQAQRLASLVLANLGAESSSDLTRGIFEAKLKMPFYPVDRWVLLGPIKPPADPHADPVDRDFSALLKHRAFEKPVRANGKNLNWIAPTDFNNGLGVAGMVDISKVYNRTMQGQTAIAISHIWSSYDRKATFMFGADWHLKVELNGNRIFKTGGDVKSNVGRTYGKDFVFTVKAPLKKGWNEVICTIAAGSAGHAFWFQYSNPGDAIEAQKITPPKKPYIFLKNQGMLKFKDLGDESKENSFSLYSEVLTGMDDPYLFIYW